MGQVESEDSEQMGSGPSQPDIATLAKQISQQQLLDKIAREREFEEETRARALLAKEKKERLAAHVDEMLSQKARGGGIGDIISSAVGALSGIFGGPSEESAAQDPAAMAAAVSQQQMIDKIGRERFMDEELRRRAQLAHEEAEEMDSAIREIIAQRKGHKGEGGEVPADVLTSLALPVIAMAAFRKLEGKPANGAGAMRLAHHVARLNGLGGEIPLRKAVEVVHNARGVLAKEGGFLQFLMPLLPTLIPAATKLLGRLFGRGAGSDREREAQAALPHLLMEMKAALGTGPSGARPIGVPIEPAQKVAADVVNAGAPMEAPLPPLKPAQMAAKEAVNRDAPGGAADLEPDSRDYGPGDLAEYGHEHRLWEIRNKRRAALERGDPRPEPREYGSEMRQYRRDLQDWKNRHAGGAIRWPTGRIPKSEKAAEKLAREMTEGTGGRARRPRVPSRWNIYLKEHIGERGAEESFGAFAKRMATAYRE